ncbi:MAG: gliding motility protein GldC [Bacteroidetes bacterium]|jgi:gliding motility-associated protein GldC|nr:gliding motility protein GldC [Bacteroidota bacterium]MDA0903339.1 gliding motility protein GldC [Bacteroidota bacterium]MDA0946764.1 gliding motility protein GldC [Bacteroidota bacterium]MDA1242305.1 gliding motility protein GldC [Bacteroidota bacterium]
MATSRITIDVTTDENHVPVAMEWTAEDGGVNGQSASAMALSMWNPKDYAAMRMDLWTKDMSVEEMRSFVVQTMMTLADTYERATSDKDHAKAIRGFTEELAKRIGVLEG